MYYLLKLNTFCTNDGSKWFEAKYYISFFFCRKYIWKQFEKFWKQQLIWPLLVEIFPLVLCRLPFWEVPLMETSEIILFHSYIPKICYNLHHCICSQLSHWNHLNIISQEIRVGFCQLKIGDTFFLSKSRLIPWDVAVNFMGVSLKALWLSQVLKWCLL